MAAAILTVPDEIKHYKRYFLTGNEYLSLPEINPLTGGIESLNVLHMGSCSMLEFAGTNTRALLQPFLIINGREKILQEKMNWFYRHYWQPGFFMRGKGWKLSGRIITPVGHRGGIYLLRFKNTTSKKMNVNLGFYGTWGAVYRTVFKRGLLMQPWQFYWDNWTNSLVMEMVSAIPLVALAVADSSGSRWSYIHDEQSLSASYNCSSSYILAPGEECDLAFYFAVNIDGDGAATTLIDLKRRGWKELESEQAGWLKERSYHTDIPLLDSILNRNLFFNYFFALGRSLDNEEQIPLTSRSSRYYVSAAFWSRDTFLWSYPSVLLVDQAAAREMLLTVFQRHLKRAGEHAHYINGNLLYPGMELDQLCAYFLGLKQYVEYTGDYHILKNEEVYEALQVLLQKLLDQKDPEYGLYTTFLDPCDDPPAYPFLIYNNVLVWCVLKFLSRLRYLGYLQLKQSNKKSFLETIDFELSAKELKDAIYEQGIVNRSFGAMFSWAVDGEGRFELYDAPPGSLQLLAYYGFCSRDEDVYKNTVRWIRSSYNPFNHVKAPFNEVGCRHAANPWPLAAANDLLAENQGALNFLLRAGMDNGFACETVNPSNGIASTGRAFASAAGFLSYALWWRFVRKKNKI